MYKNKFAHLFFAFFGMVLYGTDGICSSSSDEESLRRAPIPGQVGGSKVHCPDDEALQKSLADIEKILKEVDVSAVAAPTTGLGTWIHFLHNDPNNIKYQDGPAIELLECLRTRLKGANAGIREETINEMVDLYFEFKIHHIYPFMRDLPLFLREPSIANTPKFFCIFMMAYTLADAAEKKLPLFSKLTNPHTLPDEVKRMQTLYFEPSMRSWRDLYFGMIFEHGWASDEYSQSVQHENYGKFVSLNISDPFYILNQKAKSHVFEYFDVNTLLRLRGVSTRMKYHIDNYLKHTNVSLRVKRNATGEFHKFAGIPMRALTLTSTNFNEVDLKVVEKMPLRSLEIDLQTIDASLMYNLVVSLNRLTALTELSFHAVQFEGKGLDNFDYLKAPSLVSLKFDRIDLAAAPRTKSLWRFLQRSPQLRSLQLSQCGFESLASMQRLERILKATAQGCTGLTALDLSHNSIGSGHFIRTSWTTGDGYMFDIVKVLENMSGVPLTTLTLQGVVAEHRLDNLAHAFGRQLNFPSLHTLDLTGDPINQLTIGSFIYGLCPYATKLNAPLTILFSSETKREKVVKRVLNPVKPFSLP